MKCNLFCLNQFSLNLSEYEASGRKRESLLTLGVAKYQNLTRTN